MSDRGPKTEAGPSYRDSLNLLQTDFPMKGDLPRREPEMLARWEAEGLQAAIARRHAAAKTRYILHDGPPYANGDIHLGHALNKSLKDFVVRHRTMMGAAAPYVPGWDCHGLPIEHQVIKTLGPEIQTRSVLEIRRLCHDYAMKYVDIQREQFKRLGVGGLWDTPYLTLSPEYEAGILEALRDIVAKGLVYRGLKPVHWDPIYRTALAEAELEYHDDEDPSIHVKFPVVDAERHELLRGRSDPAIVIWTTTPWTLPGNVAVCLHPAHRYAVVRAGDSHFVVARERVDAFVRDCRLGECEIVGEAKGETFEGLLCRHPVFADRRSPVILGDHVTLDTGTGCVHTAPGHGMEDYVIGLKYHLPVFVPVDEAGCFTEDYPPLRGKAVLESNAVICEDLKARGLLMSWGTIVHPYPHSWRTKEKVIMRATTQWFLDVTRSGVREDCLRLIRQVTWIPRWGEDRITAMMQMRPDWCLSRQRSWGVPIPAALCAECGDATLTPEIIDRVIAAVRGRGTDVWFTEPVETWLPPGFACPKCGARHFHRETDILDVWFDSGASHIACCERRPELGSPVDLYLEGSDQHRGWFQTSLLIGVGARGRAPYRAVLTHGFTLDGEGRAMSKSLGNVIAPSEITDRFGADVLRLWVASADFRDDMRLSPEILDRLAEAYRRLRNTFRFLLINTSDFDPTRPAPAGAMREVDRFALHRLADLIARVRQAHEAFEFHKVFHLTHQFCAVDLSSLYLDVIKDRLYCELAEDPARRAAQTVAWHCLDALLRLLAPILVFTTDEAWRHHHRLPGEPASVHLADFAAPHPEWLDPALAERWETLLAVRGEVTKAIEQARAERRMGKSLEAKVVIAADPPAREALAALTAGELCELLIVSGVEVREAETLGVTVLPADGARCARCWRVLPSTGANPKFPATCARCGDVLEALGHGR